MGPSATIQDDLEVYRVSWLRKAVVLASAIFLGAIAIFFFAMAVPLAAGGDWLLVAFLITCGVIVGALVVYLVVVYVAFARLRIELGPDAVHLWLPAWHGTVPRPPVIESRVAYTAIDAIEERSEIYRTLGMPVVVRAFGLVANDGARYVIGNQDEVVASSAIPCDQIAHSLARRANLNLKTRGTVEAGNPFVSFIKGRAPDWSSMPVSERAAGSARYWAGIVWRTAFLLAALTVMLRVLFSN